VAVGLTNGRLFLVNSEWEPSPQTQTMGEGTFVMTELGNSEHLSSLTYIKKPSSDVLELWVGESQGYISVFSIKDEVRLLLLIAYNTSRYN